MGQPSSPPVVVGVDSSTQSCTVQLREADGGSMLGQGRAPHPPTGFPVSEQHPAAWWAAFEQALAEAVTTSGVARDRIVAISVGAQCHGLVMLDENDQVIRPAKLWNDTTSAPQARALVDDRGRAAWARAIGLVPSAAITLTKLAWVAEHEPATVDRISTVLLPHDWITWRLCGRVVTDRSDASGTGYYAAHDGTWRLDLLAQYVSADVDWAPCLPEVLGPDEPAGTVTSEMADHLGLGQDVLVGPGGGDQHLGAVGVGVGPGDVVYSIGTSGVVLTTSADRVVDESGWIDGVADATGGYLPLICTLNATKVTDTFARLLGVGLGEFGALALEADPGADRPVLRAWLDGERTPPRPTARGLLGGLGTQTSRADLALTAVEGVVFGLANGHAAINAAGVPTDGAVVAVGGGARSAAYRQVIADVLGRPVTTRDADEATARGACVQAAAVHHGDPIVDVRDRWRPPVESETPPRDGVQPGVPPRYHALVADDVGEHDHA